MPDEPVAEGVILAAGLSSRAGAFKPELPIGGKPMIAWCLEGMQAVCRRIVVVGGHEIERLRRLLAGYANVECIENPQYRDGMFTSVKAGLGAVRGDICFVIPADVPLVPPDVYRKLLGADAEIAVPTHQGKKGHPVCLARSVIARVLCEPDHSSLRKVIWTLGFRTVEVGAEEILLDLDTPEDYEAIRSRSR